MKKLRRELLLIIMIAFLAQGCCIFQKGGWDPLPCTKSKKSNDNKKDVQNVKVKED